MSVLVQFVVRQFDFLEGNHLLHQLLSGERGVRVDVQPAGEEEAAGHILGRDWLRRRSKANVRCPINAQLRATLTGGLLVA